MNTIVCVTLVNGKLCIRSQYYTHEIPYVIA